MSRKSILPPPDFGSLPDSALALSERLSGAGFRHAVGGGWVRDMIWGRSWRDIDLFVEGDCDSLLLDRGFRRIHPDGIFERRADRLQAIRVTSIEGRLRDHDFTINCAGVFPDGKVIAYSDAISDMERGILRVNPLCERERNNFVTRGCRFAAAYDLDIDPGTWEMMRSLYRCCGYRQVTERIEFVFSSDRTNMAKAVAENPEGFFALFSQCAFCGVILPEISSLFRKDEELARRIIRDSLCEPDPRERLIRIIRGFFAYAENRDETDLQIRLDDLLV